ncbi:protein gp20, partial [Listeria monocytogenes FSL F2-208]
MTKIVKMSEKNEHGTLEQFYPETHAEAVKGLVSVTEEDKTTWSGKETTAGAEQKANAALNSAKDYVDTIT